jgi:hypothetical protein
MTNLFEQTNSLNKQFNNQIVDIAVMYADQKFNTHYDVIVAKTITTDQLNDLIQLVDDYAHDKNVFVSMCYNDDQYTQIGRYGQETTV